MNEEACLGYVSGADEPYYCANNFKGTLCTNCKSSFYKTKDFDCKKCPKLAKNIILLLLLLILTIGVFVLFIYSSLKGGKSKKSVVSTYLKILLNHI